MTFNDIDNEVGQLERMIRFILDLFRRLRYKRMDNYGDLANDQMV